MAVLSELTLYHYPMTRSVRVLWLLHELGPAITGPITVKRVDLMKGEGHEDWFLAINPNHAVPALSFVDAAGERVVMFESCAIVQFLADSLAAGHLAPLPGLTKARAEYEKWMWFGGSWMDQLLWQIRQHGKRGILPADQQDPRVVSRIEKKWRAEIEPQLCTQLTSSGGPFLLGEFSAVDCVVGHCLRWSKVYGLSVVPELDSYLRNCANREAFKSAYADAGTFDSSQIFRSKL